jgi:subtilisin family serine protease
VKARVHTQNSIWEVEVIRRSCKIRGLGFASVAVAVLLATTHLELLIGQGQPKFRTIQDAIPGQYIVVLDEAVAGPRGLASRSAEIAQALAAQHAGIVQFVYRHALNGFSIEMTEADARALSQDPLVEYVIPDAPVRLSGSQSNPPSWGLDRVDQRWLPLNGVYNYNTTGLGVRAYVIDSGIRVNHPDFGGRAFVSAAADFVGDGRNGDDCLGHGTHVAGTIGGNLYGVAKQVTLHGVRVFDCDGLGTTTAMIIAAVDWVTANRVLPAVANMSLRSGANDAMDTAVRNSIASGVVYVVAAGNDGDNASFYSPARVAEAITVGATTITDVRWSSALGTSNFGTALDLFAPGHEIRSTWPSGVSAESKGCTTAPADSAICSGTSMASPHVAGAVAMYLQTNTGASPGWVEDVIVGYTTINIISDPGPGSPNRFLHANVLNPPPGGPNTLTAGQVLQPDQARISADGRFHFYYQGDGNLVLYRWDATPLWATGVLGSVGHAVMQHDGNFVVYDASGNDLFNTETYGNPGAFLRVENSGEVVVYRADGARLWSNGTCCW